ncbi:MAG: ATP-dependent DNA ligase [Microgenomates group bacterium]
MKFAKLANYFSALEATSSRLKITEILASLLKEASAEEVDKICYLSLGRLAPLYAGVEFNLAEKLMIKVLAQAFGKSEEKIRQEFKNTGDLGDTVFNLKTQDSNVKSKMLNLSIVETYQRLLEIAKESGEGSVERKIGKMVGLINDLDPLSAKYVVRIPLGRLRLGFSELTILDALSWMLVGDKSKREEIEAAYNVRADVGEIAKELKIKNEKLKMTIKNLKIKTIFEELKKIKPQLGIPIMPALCQRLPTPEEMIEKMALVAAEPKFDGTRLQVHYRRSYGRPTEVHSRNVWIFTRNLENVTAMFPDIVGALNKEVKVKEAIFDGEAIGFDPKTGKFLPFQETIKRKRKYEIGKKAKEIPLKYFVFDILYKDGESLLDFPLEKRRKILEQALSPKNQRIVLTPQIVTDSPSELRRFHDEQIAAGLEGAVVKKWQSPYEPGRRGYTWVKFKAEKKGKRGGGLADTLDCVVMGYYKGKGKRAAFGIGAFLVGIRESENSDRFLTISKIGTGLTDEQWRELKVKSQKLKVKSQPKEYKVDKNLTPDVWCQPQLVAEIEADNITISPVHTAGLALRFPRLLRFREDKSPQEATTLAEAKKLYKMQK